MVMNVVTPPRTSVLGVVSFSRSLKILSASRKPAIGLLLGPIFISRQQTMSRRARLTKGAEIKRMRFLAGKDAP
jgi:hypothetical protein